MRQGPLAALMSMSFCATVSPMPLRFLGTGGSLRETGFVFTRPHLTALANVLERSTEAAIPLCAGSGRPPPAVASTGGPDAAA